jgi:hypothetical protein
MERENLTPMVYTPFADLDLLYGEEEQVDQAPPTASADEREPETVDAFNAQILAGLVSP